VLTVGPLRAVEAAPCDEAGQLGDPDAEDLLGQDVVDPLLQVRELVGQSLDEPLGDLAEEDSGLRERVEVGQRRVGPDVRAVMISSPGLSDEIEHPVRELGRGEDLVVRQVRDAGEDVRIPVP
jgi:hypothetical protein